VPVGYALSFSFRYERDDAISPQEVSRARQHEKGPMCCIVDWLKGEQLHL